MGREENLTNPHCPILSCGGEMEEWRRKEFNDTSYFYSLPQGERREN
jgi:hypothetical protein